MDLRFFIHQQTLRAFVYNVSIYEQPQTQVQREIMIELFMVKVTLSRLFVDGVFLKSDPFAQVHYPLH